MIDGLWTDVDVTLNANVVHLKVYKQQHNESCGPSSLLMLIYVRERYQTAEAIMRLWCTQAEKAMAKAGGNPGNMPGVGSDSRVFDMTGGARGQILVDVLVSKKPAYGAQYYSGADLNTNIGHCTLLTPGILRVAWDGVAGAPGGAHFVVCLGIDGAGSRVFLDPWYGVVTNPSGDFPRYDTANGSFGAGPGVGTFTHLITTS